MGGRGLGVGLRTIGMFAAGIVCLLAGLLAIGFGIPINEFGLGNTLILAGAVTACTGLIVLSLWVVVKELKGMAGRLGPGAARQKGNAPQPGGFPRRAIGASTGPGRGPAGLFPRRLPPGLKRLPGAIVRVRRRRRRRSQPLSSAAI